MSFSQQLTETLGLHQRTRITVDKEFIKLRDSIVLAESTKIVLRGVLSELDMQDILAGLVRVNERWGEEVTAPVIAKVINQLLQREGYAEGDQTEIDQRTEQLMANQQIVNKIAMELERLDVPYAL